MTETTSITTIPRLDDPPEVIASGSGFPCRDFELKVVDTDTRRRARRRARGRGLRARPPRDAGLLREPRGHRGGDRRRRLVPHRRPRRLRRATATWRSPAASRDMFIVGGSNAYPAEIERALSEHPAIKQAYVVGVPHPRLGEVGFAFVELRRDAELDRRRRHRVLQGPPRRLQGPPPRRVRRRVAADRDRQDPALPAARARRSRSRSGAVSSSACSRSTIPSTPR